MSKTEIPVAWFQDAILRDQVRSRPEIVPWVKGAPKPDTPDLREATYHVMATCRGLFGLVALALGGVFVITQILGAIVHFRPELASFTWPIAVGLVLAGRAFAYSLGGSARRLVLGESVAREEAIRDAWIVFPRVFVVTLITFVTVSIGFMLCFVPGFIVLPMLVRAPYEAACGAGILDAFRRSYRAHRTLKSPSFGAANFVINGAVAFMLWRFATESLVSVGLPSVIAPIFPALALCTIEIGIWFSCMAAFITGDAVMAGALTGGNIAKLRTSQKPPHDRFMAGHAGTAVRVVVFSGGILLVVLLTQSKMLDAMRSEMPAIGSAAAEFALPDLDGTSRSLGDYAGSPTVLYAWAPWCGPCSGQVENLHELMEQRAEIQIVSVALSYGDEQEVRSYVEEKSVRYPVLLGNDGFGRDYKIHAFPTVLLLDAEGHVAQTWPNVTSADDIANEYDKLARPGELSP